LQIGKKNDNIFKINFFIKRKVKPVLNAQKTDCTGTRIPYHELYIYHLEGLLNREAEPLLGPDFLGNWIEEDTSFLFFSNPARGLVQKIVNENKRLRLIDEYYFTYEEWQGGKIKPFKVSRFLIVPSWEDDQEGDEGVKILLDPGLVFGTSLHPTTRDCLLALEKIYEKYQFQRVLDLGTGTGILALGAALLGAERILAVDINPLAVRTALLNVRLNRFEERIEVKEGLAEKFIDHPSDLLIANIHYDIILKLTKGEGFLKKKCFILSGLMRSQARDIRLQLSNYPIEILHEWGNDMIWYTILGRVNEL
jgi:ribosomal protein L11 methyltransferase